MKEIIQTKMIDRSMPSSSTLVSSATVSSTPVSSTVVSSTQHFNFNKACKSLVNQNLTTMLEIEVKMLE